MLKLIENFFTHKDFLGGLDLPGRLFSPLHLIFSACLLALIIISASRVAKKSESAQRKLLLALWAFFVIFEIVKTLYEAFLGSEVRFEVGGVLPLYPCSIYLYSLPFCFSKNRRVKVAACGYLFTVGLLGAAINFVYPANVLSNYSCISFMGFHTLSFHGTMLFSMLVMLISGYHRYNGVQKFWELILPALPMLIMSIPANIVNDPKVDVYDYIDKNDTEMAPIVRQFPEASAFYRIKIRAMEPIIYPGDVLALAPYIDGEEDVIPGDIYVVETNTNGLVTRILFPEDDGYRAVSSKPDKHPDFLIRHKNIKSISRIVGLLRTTVQAI